MSNKSNCLPPEVEERAIRMVQENRGEYRSLWAAIESIAAKIGCVPQTLHEWVRKHKVDAGARPGITSDERERDNVREREPKELRRANEILKLASAFLPRQATVAMLPSRAAPNCAVRVPRWMKLCCHRSIRSGTS